MYKLATLSALLGLVLSACMAPPEVTTALSQPDKSLFDQRLPGFWYSHSGYLRILPQTDGSTFDVFAITGLWDQKWLRATAYASQIDGETYYNIKRTAWVGNDYTAEGTGSFLILKPDFVDGSAMFLRFIDPSLVTSLTAQGRIKVWFPSYTKEHVSYMVVDTSREDFIRLIREIGADKLFSVVWGPFYRVEPPDQKTTLDANAGTFGIWQVDCQGTSDTVHASDCIVRDAEANIVISPASTRVEVGKDRCETQQPLIQVDQNEASQFPLLQGAILAERMDLLERMHFGRILHIEYEACPSHETKRVDLPLNGFASAFAAASAESLKRPFFATEPWQGPKNGGSGN